MRKRKRKRVRLNSNEVWWVLCSIKSHPLSEDNWWWILGPLDLQLARWDPTTTLIAVHTDSVSFRNSMEFVIHLIEAALYREHNTAFPLHEPYSIRRSLVGSNPKMCLCESLI